MRPDTRLQLNFLCSAGPRANTTMDRAHTKELLLATGGQILSGGILYNIKVAHLGAGVYRHTLKRAN